MPKLLFICMNLMILGLIIWKLKSWGVIPLTSADWVTLLPPKSFLDYSSF